ncbi:hypothetical protein COEREDRAFT_89133 [Coemansia reversa NRRL 1564]|uniref:Uncharacterized protein n=1 Tax=Coemansia reversa (strain ATCC 12441 / NRRL 1564) TaxID=763665 RepID=A0A2G5B5B7_COERN|nr:hypothetical protein COEREDRAFT_89133 [Coemansia reversa NRRL 1564]|eukprot:PIA13917.1 hypothetical protein COEREDRAFT_89133 [Coemansia reversa NRRL 1564]
MNVIIRSCPGARRVAGQKWLHPALAVPLGRRAYTKVDMYTKTEYLSPIEMQKFLQNRDRELKEFLEDESEMIASDSFFLDSSVHSNATDATPAAASDKSAKGVNEEFAKQIQDLIHPNYGSESQ